MRSQPVIDFRISTKYNKKLALQQRNKTHIMKTKRIKKEKNDQIKQFKLRCDFLKISTDLLTEFAAAAHLAEGQ
jgi:hypothetical protein